MRWNEIITRGVVWVAVFCSLIAARPAVGANDLSLNLVAGSELVSPGDTITMTLDVSNLVDPITGIQVLLRYDNTLMTLVNIVPAVVVGPPAEGWVEIIQADNNGDVDWAAVINGDSILVSHTLALLTFTAMAEGTANVTFRPDEPPIITKMTRAGDHATVVPGILLDSGLITSICDDGLFCNGAETFDGFVCQPGTDPCNDGVACTDDACDEVLDACTNTTNNANCSDGVGCTDDVCDAVLDCQSTANDVNCNDGVGCTNDVCDPILDCQFTADNANCDDLVGCTDDVCDPVLDCQFTANNTNCDDLVGCTIDTCDAINDCQFTPSDALCDNTLFCDGAETCDPALDCVIGTSPCDDGVGCTDDVCDEVNDTCTSTANSANCDDLVGCTDDVCDPVLDCQFTANNAICDDLIGCTDDVCDPVLDCQFTANNANCTDGVVCTDDVCDPVLDCQFTANNANCTDGVVCTDDVCDPLLDCQFTANDANCDDLVGCTDDVCDPLLDCQFTANNANCDDLVGCTDDVCDSVLDCQFTANDTNCTDGVGCTDDTCDPVNDCQFTANDVNCDNLLFCDGVETCDALLDCQAGSLPCNDGVVCTDDSCDEAFDTCANVLNDLNCDDGLFCNGAETCDAVLDCRPGSDPCTPLICDEALDLCGGAPTIMGLELFYAGKFLDQPDPGHGFLAGGGVADATNVTNHTQGVTGIRIIFDSVVTFSTTPEAALIFDWTTGTGTTFSAVSNVATAITVTSQVVGTETVVTVVLLDGHVRQRWLRVTVDSTQITSNTLALDGELFGNPATLPSGDSIPGGNAVFYIGNVSGDINGDQKTLLGDVGSIRLQVNPFQNVLITNPFDVDKSGKIQLSDVGVARQDVNPFFVLPLLAP